MTRTITFEELIKLDKKGQIPKEIEEFIRKNLQSVGGMMLWTAGMKSGTIMTFDNVEWDFGKKKITIHPTRKEDPSQ